MVDTAADLDETATPARQDTEQLARRALVADAVYCFAVGSTVVASAHRLHRPLGLPAPMLWFGGAATVAWSGAVGAASATPRWRAAVAGVAAANVVASAALASLARSRPHRLARWGVALTAVEVGAFAAVQGAILLRAALDADPTGT